MIKLTVSYDGTDYILPFRSDNLQIVKQVDTDNDLIVRTSCEGDLLFSCSEYDFLYPFLTSYDNLNGNLSITDCDGIEVIYNGYLTLNNEFDYFTKEIKGKFTIKDKYFEFYSQKGDDNNYPKVTALNAYVYLKYLNINVPESYYTQGISRTSFKLGNLIDTLVNFIDNSVISNQSASGIGQDLFVPKECWFNNNGNLYAYIDVNTNETTKPFVFPQISFNNLMNILKTQIFIQWFIDEDNTFQLIQRKNVFFATGEDITIYEKPKNKLIKIDNQKITNYKIENFNFIEDKNKNSEKYHASANLVFSINEKNTNTVSADLQTNPFDFSNSKDFLFRTIDSGIELDFGKIVNSQWINYKGEVDYLLGDWDNLTFTGMVEGDRIISDYLYLPEGNKRIEFNYNYTISGAYYTGRLKLSVLTYGPPVNVYTFDIGLGSNTFYLSDSVKNTCLIFLSCDSTGLDLDSNMTAFKLFCEAGSFSEVASSVIMGDYVPNGMLSNYTIISDYAANMPIANGTLKIADVTTNLTNLHVKNDLTQQIDIPLKNNIENVVDFNKTFVTSLGEMRIMKASQKIIKNNLGNTSFELTTKF